MLNRRSLPRTLGFVVVVAGALVAASAAPASAAKGVPGPPHSPGDEGGEEAGNNLSVPALFVPGTAGLPVPSGVTTCRTHR